MLLFIIMSLWSYFLSPTPTWSCFSTREKNEEVAREFMDAVEDQIMETVFGYTSFRIPRTGKDLYEILRQIEAMDEKVGFLMYYSDVSFEQTNDSSRNSEKLNFNVNLIIF